MDSTGVRDFDRFAAIIGPRVAVFSAEEDGMRIAVNYFTVFRRVTMKSNQGGFTLVEIAIVLVIIGLLLGGVLKGQELINSAKVKNLANDFRSVPTMVFAYQDRMALARTLSMAEGFTHDADRSQVHVIRGSLQNPTVLVADYTAVLSGRQRDLQLEPGDIVYVPTTKIASS